MRVRIQATGPASGEEMWSAYAETSRWQEWAPQIRRVEPHSPLKQGLRGEVDGPLGIKARFEVTSVDESAGRWAWKVSVGPAHLAIDHEVTDGRTAVVIAGPAAFVLAYAPVARLALGRLANPRGAEGGLGVVRNLLRGVLAVFMGIAGVGHLVATTAFLGQVPDFFPFRTPIVLVSGIVEIAFAMSLALLHERRLRQAGWALAAFFVLIFPGNLYQALAQTDAFGLDTPAARWGRLLAQPVLIVWALWSTGAWPRRRPT